MIMVKIGQAVVHKLLGMLMLLIFGSKLLRDERVEMINLLLLGGGPARSKIFNGSHTEVIFVSIFHIVTI